MPTELLVIGASGHAKVLIEAIKASDQSCRIVLADQDSAKVGKQLLGDIAIIALENWAQLPEYFQVAIGNNQIRQKLSKVAQEHGKKPCTVTHPDAHISPSADIGCGSFVAAKAIVGAEASISEGCVINHGSIVDHDCRVGAFSHIAPNATLGGGVEVGHGCLIGAGATILPMVKIGCHAFIGAGAVITADVPDHQTVVGVPGRCVSSDE